MNLEEEMFNLNGGFYGFKSKRQMEEHKQHIKHFCSKYNAQLISVDFTIENGYIEPAYSFSDGLGHYTIEGIKKSLLDILSHLN